MSESLLEPSVTNPDADGIDNPLEPDPQHKVDPDDVPEGASPH